MTRDECRLPGCDRAPGQQAREDYRDGRFCSIQHETKFDHLKADARDAREADREVAAEVGGR
jgi:hypothetical protein